MPWFNPVYTPSLFFLFVLIDLYWSIIASQYRVRLRCTTKRISHMRTHYTPSLDAQLLSARLRMGAAQRQEVFGGHKMQALALSGSVIAHAQSRGK